MKIRVGNKFIHVAAAVFGALVAGQALAAESWEAYLDQVRIKQAIADSLTPAQLQERRERLARWLEQQAQLPQRAPGDTCAVATNEVSTLPFNPAADTTVGQVDNYDLPADTTNPTCAAPTTCTGTGTAGSLPRGAIYTGTGTGPDRAYKIRTNVACTLNVTIDPTSTQDLAAIVYQTQCSSNLADCGCVSDAGVGGATETISLTTVAGTDYFVVADGYSTGATPPGPSGPFTLSITETSATGCQLVGAASADLSITKTDGVTSVNAGGTATYTIVASNAGPDAVNGATVADTFPAACTSVSWTCTGAGGGTCTANGSGNISDTVNLPSGGSVTYTAACAVSSGASGSLANTATVAGIGGVAEVNPANNSATDTDTINSIAAPQFTYTPAAGSAVNFTGGTLEGSTGSASIAVAIGTPGLGTGASATTTTTCVVPGGFSGFGQTVTAEGAAATTTGGPLSGTCVLGAAQVVQTMTCTENQGGTNVTRTFDLTCPAGTAATLTSTPVSGSTVTLPSQIIGTGATTSAISFQNPGLVPATVTCVAPAAPFTANPLTINVPAGGSASTTVSLNSATAGVFADTLTCSAGQQQFTFALAGTANAPSVPVPDFGDRTRLLLVISALLMGMVTLGLRARRG